MSIENFEENLYERIGLNEKQITAIAETEDKKAEAFKTETITLRVSPRVKKEIQRAAEANGCPELEGWVIRVIYQAVAATFPGKSLDSEDNC